MTPELAVVVDNSASVKEEALTWPQRAQRLEIVDNATYTEAAEMLKGIKALRGRVREIFGSIKAKAHEAWKESVAKEREVEAPLEEAERICKRGMVAYDEEQERKRRDEQRRLAEEQRQRDEVQRLEDAAALEREAIATGDASAQAEAERLIEEPPPMAAPVTVAKATPKVEGISYRTTYGAELVSLKALVAAAVEDDRWLSLLQFNQTAANGLARSLKAQLKVPGIRLVSNRVAAARGR